MPQRALKRSDNCTGPSVAASDSATQRTASEHTKHLRVDTQIRAELGMESRARHVAITQQHGLAAVTRQHFDVRAELCDTRRADEDQRQLVGVVARFEAVELTTVAVASDGGIDETEAMLRGISHLTRGEYESRTSREQGQARLHYRAQLRFQAKPCDQLQLNGASS